MPSQSVAAARTYRIVGVPLRSGSLTPGSEDDARPYRNADLVGRLAAAGCHVQDDGDLPIPSYLPHHRIPPIRNWPGPRIVWEIVGERLAPVLEQPGQVPVLVGCDCSIVVGTAQALRAATNGDVHVIYVDGDFDDAPPDPAQSQSAAALAVWLLTNASPFWPGPPLEPSQVTIIGTTEPSRSPRSSVNPIPLSEVQRLGARVAARQALDAIPPSAAILLHLDTDVVQPRDLPATYFPHPAGMRWEDAHALVCELLADPRVRLVEVSEYAALRDVDGGSVERLVGLLVDALKP